MFSPISSKVPGQMPAVGTSGPGSTQPINKPSSANTAAAASSKKAANAEAKKPEANKPVAQSSAKKSQWAVVRWAAAFTAWVGLLLAGAGAMAQRCWKAIKSFFTQKAESPVASAKPLPDASRKTDNAPAASSKPLPKASSKSDGAPKKSVAKPGTYDLAPPLASPVCCKGLPTIAVQPPVQKTLPAESEAVVLYRSPESFAPGANASSEQQTQTGAGINFVMSKEAYRCLSEMLFVRKYANELPPVVAERSAQRLPQGSVINLEPVQWLELGQSDKAYSVDDDFQFTTNTLLNFFQKNSVHLNTAASPVASIVFPELNTEPAQRASIIEMGSDENSHASEEQAQEELGQPQTTKPLRPLRLDLTPYRVALENLSSDEGSQSSSDSDQKNKHFRYTKGLGRASLLS